MHHNLAVKVCMECACACMQWLILHGSCAPMLLLMHVGEVTGHDPLKAHVPVSKFPVSFCFVLVDYYWSSDHLHHQIQNHAEFFYSYEKQQRSYEWFS